MKNKLIKIVALLGASIMLFTACSEDKNTTESTDSSINTTTIEKEIEVIEDNEIVKTDTETIQEEFAEIGLGIEFFECTNQDFINTTVLSAHEIDIIPFVKITNISSDPVWFEHENKLIDRYFEPGEEYYCVISTNIDTGAKNINVSDFTINRDDAVPDKSANIIYQNVSFDKSETIMDGEWEYYYMPLIDDYDEVIQYFTFYYDENDNIVAFDNEKHFGNAAFADDKHYPLLIDSSGIEWVRATVHYKIYTED